MFEMGTVLPRLEGIDDKGFLKRMFPVMRYRPLERHSDYRTKGVSLILPLDALDPKRMLKEVYQFSDDDVERIMVTLTTRPIADYTAMDKETYAELDYVEREFAELAYLVGSDTVWLPSKTPIAALADAVVLPVLYGRKQRPERKRGVGGRYNAEDGGFEYFRHADKPMAEGLEEDRAKKLAWQGKDFKLPEDGDLKLNWIHRDIPTYLQAPGTRWAFYMHDLAMFAWFNHLNQNVMLGHDYREFQTKKIEEIVERKRHYVTYDETMVVYY